MSGRGYAAPVPDAAFFDLDGTLLTVNSADLWVRREHRLGMLDMESALRAALGTLRGIEESFIRAETHQWWRDEVRRFIAPGGRAVLDRHRQRGDLLVLLTSSSRYASEMAREEFGLDDVICQGYEIRDGRFTGEPLRPICYGPGKVVAALVARSRGWTTLDWHQE